MKVNLRQISHEFLQVVLRQLFVVDLVRLNCILLLGGEAEDRRELPAPAVTRSGGEL